MRDSAKTKRFLVLAALAVLALFIAGFITGAIGAKFLGREEGVLPEPHVVLPPQPVFPGDALEHFVEWEEHPEETDAPFGPLQFFVSNTLLSSWITTIVLLLIFVGGSLKLKMVPGRLQSFLEIVVETFVTFVEGVAGKEFGRRLFPVIATIFLFVAFNAWMGLNPIYQSLGFIKDGHVVAHLLRPAGTDMNMPLALALCAFVFVEFLGLRHLGLHYVGKFVRVGSLKRGLSALFRGRLMDAFQGFLDFFFIGPLEGFSEFARIISFTFRLFGNMTAGEILVVVSAFLVSFVATVGVYALEMLVGFIQGLIFAGLTLVFATLALTPHAEEEH